MKILKTKTYNALNNNIRDLNYEINRLRHELQLARGMMAFNIKFERFIIGGKGSGKTTFLVKKIIPNLTDCFVFCHPHSGKYDYSNVKDENKFYYDTQLSTMDNVRNIQEVIKKNKDKVLIFDDYEFLSNAKHLLFNDLFGLNYFIVFQSASLMEKYLNFCTVIYTIGVDDYFFKLKNSACLNQRTTVVRSIS